MSKLEFNKNLYLSNEQFVDFLKYLSNDFNKEFGSIEFEVLKFGFPTVVKAKINKNDKVKTYNIDFYHGMFILSFETNLNGKLCKNWQEKFIEFKTNLFGEEFTRQYEEFLRCEKSLGLSE